MSVLLLCLVAFLASFSVAYGITNYTNQMYVFAYSWTPEFCYGKTASYPGCATPEAYWGKYYTIHGLWPQYADGTGYPHDCTTEPFDLNVVYKIGWDRMTQYWPNVQAAETDPNYDSFWIHEWSKHGTCTGLSQYAYFSLALNLQQRFGTPSILTNAVGGNLSASDLRTAMGGSQYVALQCTNGKYLNGAYSCWSQEYGVPIQPRICPPDVQAEDTCTASTLIIQSF